MGPIFLIVLFGTLFYEKVVFGTFCLKIRGVHNDERVDDGVQVLETKHGGGGTHGSAS